MAKKITLENLAGMIKKGFDGADKRFDLVDKKLEKIELKLENLVTREEFKKLETRVKMIEEALAIKK